MMEEQMDSTQTPESQGLEGLIQNSQYQTIDPVSGTVTPVDMNGPSGNVIQEARIDPSQVQTSGDPSTPLGTVQGQQAPQGVTTPEADPFAAERQRYEAILAGQQQQAALLAQTVQQQAQQISQVQQRQQQAAEAQFRQNVKDKVEAGELTYDQGIDAVARYEAQKAQKIAQHYQTQAQRQIQNAQQGQEALEKSMVINLTMQQYGLPESVRVPLQNSRTLDEFDALVASYLPFIQNQPTPEAQQALQRQQELRESGALVTSGDNAGTPPQSAPQERSGDILGLIQATSYQYVSGS
jgi:hypothetical protein